MAAFREDEAGINRGENERPGHKSKKEGEGTNEEGESKAREGSD